jgi:hypothetical protein
MIFALLPAVFVVALVLAIAWFVTVRDLRAAGALGWPQTLRLVGLLASTILVPLPYAMALLVDPHHQKGIAWSMAFAVLLFVLSIPGAILQKGLLRYGLILCSVFLLGFAGLIYLATGITF